MPVDVATALTESGVRRAYDERPAYQRNDYIGWIERAKTADTRSRANGHSWDELAALLDTSPHEARLRFDPDSPIADGRWPYDTD